MYKIRAYEQISSTQIALINDIKTGAAAHPVMYLALRQSAGIGSNGRQWQDAGSLVVASAEPAESIPDFRHPGGIPALEISSISAPPVECSHQRFIPDFRPPGEFCSVDLRDLPQRFSGVFDVFLSFTHRPAGEINSQNASIYYASLIQQILRQNGSECYVKWPNDLYLRTERGGAKFGGLITYKSKNCCIIGVGINQLFAPEGAAVIDAKIAVKDLLLDLQEHLKNPPSWKEIFQDYARNFHKNYDSFVKHEGQIFSLKDAKLYQDGSILINNQRIYGLR